MAQTRGHDIMVLSITIILKTRLIDIIIIHISEYCKPLGYPFKVLLLKSQQLQTLSLSPYFCVLSMNITITVFSHYDNRVL